MKTFTYRVYSNKNGSFLGLFKNVDFSGFTKIINGGLGECVLKIDGTFESFDEYNKVQLNNYVEILVSDIDTANDTLNTGEGYRLIYSGYISKYSTWVDGPNEGVNVNLLGYSTKLMQGLLKDAQTGKVTFFTNTSDGISTTGPAVITDVGDVVKGILGQYIKENPTTKITYSGETLTQTGTNGMFTFELMSYQQAFNYIKSIAPSEWWWYINADNMFYFKTKPSSATHTFVYGKDFKSIKVEKSIEKIKNAFLFWDGDSTSSIPVRYYKDKTSILYYNPRVEILVDYSQKYGGTAEANNVARNFLDTHKNPDIQVIVEIVDNNETDEVGYDIENIDPGDTCRFVGFNKDTLENFKDNMLITRVDYTPTSVVLTIEPMQMGIIPQMEKNKRNIDDILSTSKTGNRAEDSYLSFEA